MQCKYVACYVCKLKLSFLWYCCYDCMLWALESDLAWNFRLGIKSKVLLWLLIKRIAKIGRFLIFKLTFLNQQLVELFTFPIPSFSSKIVPDLHGIFNNPKSVLSGDRCENKLVILWSAVKVWFRFECPTWTANLKQPLMGLILGLYDKITGF